jgi:stage II sporulation protein D
LALAFLLAASSALAQSAEHEATDVTVRLYSTLTVRAVMITPLNASMRLCARCALSLIPAQLSVSATRGQLVVNGKAAHELDISGRIRMMTDGGPVESGAGQWKITASSDGLHVLLTIPSERYVMAVLQSEAGASEATESLKALAVTARSFALTNSHRHGAEGLCDSTLCQALRMGDVPASIESAVQATAGETLWVHGERVPGYFTQSCGGMTEDAASMWGGAHKPWLVAHTDSYCLRAPSQWHTEISSADLSGALQAEGWKLGRGIDGVHVAQRDASGRARMVQIAAAGGQMTLSAASLRFAVNRSLGWNRLRSDWYEVSFENGHIVFDGKGYGHGVGLCQAGAMGMAKEGKSYREILAFYFPSANVRVEAGDAGWMQSKGSGWTLRATSDAGLLISAGNQALLRAHALFPSDVKPTVTVYPTTELFRQASNQPGWVLGVTRGPAIALQPVSIIQKHGGAGELLLHEFLHSMVESEAGGAAPLWLREGLVEALANERGEAPRMTTAQMDAVLQHADTQAESERSHHAACGLVRSLLAKYGLQTVRGWLRNGVPRGVVAGEQLGRDGEEQRQ